MVIAVDYLHSKKFKISIFIAKAHCTIWIVLGIERARARWNRIGSIKRQT